MAEYRNGVGSCPLAGIAVWNRGPTIEWSAGDSATIRACSKAGRAVEVGFYFARRRRGGKVRDESRA